MSQSQVPTRRTASKRRLQRDKHSRKRDRAIRLEQLEDRRLLAPVFMNSFNQFDVTDDGFVVADDVLTIINYINARGSGPLPLTNNLSQKFVDVDGDTQVTASDVITVINAINAGNLPGLVALTEQHSFAEEGLKPIN